MASSTSFFLFFLTFPFLFIVTHAKCHVDDQNALLAFKSGITSDPSGLLSDWKSTTDCCTWFGITCDSNNRVRSISIYGQTNQPNSFLSGTISPSLSKLRYLDGIYLENHPKLSSPFPDFLFHLPNIQFVYLQNNNLSGRIPDKIGSLTRIYALSLAGNKFSGPIPSSISNLTQLNQLWLSNNLLTGPVPDGIRRLKDLSSLHLDDNQLSGVIPDFFTSFLNLRSLNLSHNKFTGPIPATISSLAPILRYLELGHNFLTGKIPSFLGNFQTLDTLDLSANLLTGVVPKTFANLTKIFNLDLSYNFLTDPFPAMKVKGIESLDLSYNSFHLGTIPRWVTSSTIIYSLKLAQCGIKMKLDDWKPTETYFYDYIDLSYNNISGSPVTLLNRTDYLVSFKAANNTLKFDLEKLRIPKTLTELDLRRNQVFGKLSPAVMKVKNLNVSYNMIMGGIPQPNNFTEDVFVGNGGLCGAPLFPCCPRCNG